MPGDENMFVDTVEPWSQEAAHARLLRLQATLPIVVRSEPEFMESNSNDAWLIGDAVLRVCWRGDRERFTREAQIVAALPPSIPHATLIDSGSFEELTWTLHERVVGQVLGDIWLEMSEATLRDIIAQLSTALAALHAWTPPPDVERLLTEHEQVVPLSTQNVVDVALIPLPVPRLLQLIEAARSLPHVDGSVLDLLLERTGELALSDPFTKLWPHVIHGDAVFTNVIVNHGRIAALLDFEWVRQGPRDLELMSLVRMLEDARVEHGPSIPPVLDWMRQDYPQMFATPDLDQRLWLYAIGYTIRGMVFWPPYAPENELYPTHQIHRLRRLTKAPMVW